MSAVASYADLQQPGSLLDRINALRAQSGLPPMPEGILDVALGANLGPDSRRAQLAQPVPTPQPAAQRAPQPAQNTLSSPPTTQAGGPPALPAVPAVAPDPLAAVVRQIAQFYDPGNPVPDIRKVPAATITFEVSDDPNVFTDQPKMGDPYRAGRGAGPSLKVNAPPDLGRVPTGSAPRKVFSVQVGTLTVGKFRSEAAAEAVRDRLRAVLRQGPAPSIPTVGLFSGAISTKDRELDEALGFRPKSDLAIRPGDGGTGRAPNVSGIAQSLGVRRDPFTPEEKRVVNTLEELFSEGPKRGPTLTKLSVQERAKIAVRMFQQGLITEDAMYGLVEPSGGMRTRNIEERLRLSDQYGLPQPVDVDPLTRLKRQADLEAKQLANVIAPEREARAERGMALQERKFDWSKYTDAQKLALAQRELNRKAADTIARIRRQAQSVEWRKIADSFERESKIRESAIAAQKEKVTRLQRIVDSLSTETSTTAPSGDVTTVTKKRTDYDLNQATTALESARNELTQLIQEYNAAINKFSGSFTPVQDDLETLIDDLRSDP